MDAIQNRPKPGKEKSYRNKFFISHSLNLKNRSALGICLGASSISLVRLEVDPVGLLKIIHKHTVSAEGNPKAVLSALLEGYKDSGLPVVVTGRKLRNRISLSTISEPEATEAALSLYVNGKVSYSAVASLGAETFVVYKLDEKGLITGLISKNQCASGTGEFFLQQIGRMNLTLGEAVNLSANANPYKVSGRCSVFCKSDCTHALNKGVPKEEVAAGLALMIAEKAEALLKKAKAGPVMLVGGVTRNATVVNFLKERFADIFVPEEADVFEALGAAVHGLYHEVSRMTSPAEMFSENGSLFTFHQPLEQFEPFVTFSPDDRIFSSGSGQSILGLDVGSTTTKGVIIRTSDQKIVASEYLYTHGNPIEAARKVYTSLLGQLPTGTEIIGLGVTGSGRHITALHAGTKAIVNEISAHAAAAVHFDPEVDTIFEIGGQDAKYTYLVNGVPADYAMNEACSAGTGSFIQEAAFESLHIGLTDIEAIAFQSERPLNFRDQCAALIGSDIKSALQESFSKEDIIAGLVYSICLNYINRVKGNRPVGKKIFMQGGVSYNKAIPVAMAAITGKEIVVPPLPGLMGAFGTALKVQEYIESGSLEKDHFDLHDLLERHFAVKRPFLCNDRSNGCDRKCEINTFGINGKVIAFGGACNKYYDALLQTEKNWQKNDFVRKRMNLVYHRTIPETIHNKGTVGLNQTFTINRLFPLYYTFFTKLGFKIILSDEIDEKGFENQHSSFCYPVELAHGLFGNLVSKDPDFIFIPEVYEMHVPGCENDPKDTTATCVFISKEANYLSQAFKDQYPEERIIHPYVNFAKGYYSQKKTFLIIGKQLGIKNTKVVLNAFEEAVEAQETAENRLLELGQEVLSALDKNPDELAIVLVGRDYNAFSDFANKGIPKKFASLGYKVIPYDILDSHREEIISFQSWEAGKRILRVAQTIRRHDRLFPVYVSNFSCGPDSFLIPIFRDILGDKPSLTLELDQHTADAGINTRIDAFLDVVKNFRRTRIHGKDAFTQSFQPARIIGSASGSAYIDSDGRTFDLLDTGVKIVIPCIGDMAAALFASSLRSLGYNAVALPETEPAILETGRKYTSGKECLPVVLLAGSLIDYVQNQRKPDAKIAFFNIGGASACRIAQYPVFLENLVKANKIRNVAMLTLISQEGYLGLTKGFLKRSIEAVILNDILEDVRSGILANAKDPDTGLEVFYREFNNLADVFSKDYKHLFDTLKIFSLNISEQVPCRIPVSESRYIALTGEIFVRHNQFAHKKLNHYFGKRGFILKDAYIAEWIKYLDFAWRKGVDRPEFSFRQTIDRLLREQYISLVESRMQKILSKTGYLHPEKMQVIRTIKHSLHVLPLESTGEPALTLGTALSDGYEKYCGIINVGPFGCLQTRIGEAVCAPNMNLGNKKQVKDKLGIRYEIPGHLDGSTHIPFLTIECDGKGFPQIIESRLESFVLQAERAAQHMRAPQVV